MFADICNGSVFVDSDILQPTSRAGGISTDLCGHPSLDHLYPAEQERLQFMGRRVSYITHLNLSPYLFYYQMHLLNDIHWFTDTAIVGVLYN